jgi:hypothetical protein
MAQIGLEMGKFDWLAERSEAWEKMAQIGVKMRKFDWLAEWSEAWEELGPLLRLSFSRQLSVIGGHTNSAELYPKCLYSESFVCLTDVTKRETSISVKCIVESEIAVFGSSLKDILDWLED